MELPPATPAAATVFRGSPLTGPDDGQTRAVEHEMEARAWRDRSQTAPQMLTAPGERRRVGGGEVEAPHPEQGVQEPFGLAQREMVEESQGQGGLDGEIRVPPLPTPPAAPAGRPGRDRFRGHPHRHMALLHESSLARTMPQDAAHDLPDEVPEARQKQPESGPTQLVNDQLMPNKRPISDGAARAHVR